MGQGIKKVVVACDLILFPTYIFRAVVTFGLNALHGRYKIHQDVWRGEWDSNNAYDFIKYTVSKEYHIDSWEFGMNSRNKLIFLL